MPKVPQLEGQQVQRSAGPSIRVSTDAPAEAFGVGPSGAKVVSAAGDLFKEAKDSYDKVASMEADKKLAEIETKLMHDPQTGALNTRGRNSFGVIDSTKQKYAEEYAKIEQGLANNQQKAMVAKLYNSRIVDMDRQLNSHVGREVKAHDVATTKAYIDTELNNALANPMDEERVNAAIVRQSIAAVEFGKRNGMSDVEINKMYEDTVSRTHKSVIDAMIAQDKDVAAQEYMNKNIDSIFGKDKTAVQEAVASGVLRGESQRKAQEFYTGDNLGQALKKAQSISDPKLQDATVDRVKQLHAQFEMVKRDREEKMNIKAADIIDSGGTFDDVEKAGLINGLNTGQRSELKRYAENRMKGSQPSTDWTSWYNLRRMASSPELRDEFNRIDMAKEYRTRLADTEFKELSNLQDGLRKNDPKAKSMADGIRSDMQIVNDALATMAINTGPKASKKDRERANIFYLKMDQYVASFAEKNGGKRPTNEQIDDYTKKLAAEVVVNKRSFWWDEKARAFELKPGQVVEDVVDIPDVERRKIEDFLKRRKLPMSESAIKDLYMRQLNSGVTRAEK
jgi:hypothetical protein